MKQFKTVINEIKKCFNSLNILNQLDAIVKQIMALIDQQIFYAVSKVLEK